MTVMPHEAREWTIDDLDQLPDDGLQYELLDGMLLVTPPPVTNHQRVCRELFVQLHEACPYDRFEVFFAPLGWQPDTRTSLEPDLLVVAKDRIGVKAISEPLALAVEVLSPSTRRKDMVLKRSKYEEGGVEAYWIVDPSAPAITAYELRDGKYVEIGTARDDEALALEHPFPITLVASRLVR